MRSLTISAARSTLPSLVDDIIARHETIIISRKGRPVAQLSPIPADTYATDPSRYALRGVPIVISDDFDEPMADLWEAMH
jgi:antitoxin (DNA-binding transcriptional repressor) of toxin-antitoxin stability system